MHTYKKVLLAFLLLYLPSPLCAASYQTLMEGLEYGTHSLSPGSAKLHLLRVDPKRFEVKPILATEFKKPAMSAKQMTLQGKALAVLNANFFDPQKKPLGLVLINSKVRNPIHPTRWWASWVTNGRTSKIQKIFSPAALKGYQQGIQAGPRLVIAGHPPRLKEESSAKSALGIDSQGRLLLMATEGSVSIRQLAKALATPVKQGGLGLPNALNLDGGSSTQFYIKVSNFEFSLPGLVKVPVGLGVFKKSN